MDLFKTWFMVGFDHILNVQALDHILFVLALVVVYKPSMVKQIVILITAFTIGHSITLILSALDLISYKKEDDLMIRKLKNISMKEMIVN